LFITARRLLFLALVGACAHLYGQGSQLPKYTVATLPSAASHPSYTVQVIDGTTANDCTVGGGSYNVLCTTHSGAWVPVASASITSINGNTGSAQTFESLDSSVIITQPDNSHVNLQSAGISGSLRTLVNGSPATQYVIVRPSSGTGSCPSGTTCTVGSSSAFLQGSCTGVLCNLAPHMTANWVFTGSALPSGLNPANVTAVYAYSINSASTSSTASTSTLTCNSQNVEGGTTTWSQAQGTSGALSGITGSNFTGVTCAADIGFSAPGPTDLTMNVPDIGLIVAYTGSPVTSPNAVYVATPLYFNPILSQLGIDTTGLQGKLTLTTTGTSGAATLTGNTLNIPQYAGGTTTNPLTMNNSGSGAASGTTFNGSAATTISYNTIGASGVSGSPTTGNCAKWASANTLGDAGSPCGSGGGGLSPGGSNFATQYNSGGSALGGTGPGTSGQVLTSNGASAAPTFQTNASVQYPANGTTALLIGSSLNGDDNHNFSNAITITGGSASGGTCTFTNSGSNGLSAGDWVWTGAVTGWPAQGAAYNSYTYNTGTVNDQQFQVSATGLSSSGFQVSCPNAGTATFTGGTVYTSNYWFSHRLEKMPFISGHITLSLILTGSPPTCASLNTNFATVVPNVSGHTAYLFITDCHNDFNLGSSAATVETAIQSIMAKAHTAGYLVIMATTPNAAIAGTNNGSYSFQANAYNWWLLGQAKQNGNVSSGQYWDYLVNFDYGGGPYNLNSGTNLGTSAGNQMSAYIANSVFATGGTTPTTILPYMYYGWYTGVLPINSGPGVVISNTAVDSFAVTDAAQANVGLHVDTSGTIGTREPNDTVSTALNLSYIGSSANPLCTTTNGKVVNSGCNGINSISSPDASININTPAGTPTLQLSRDLAYTFNNTHTYQAPSSSAPAAIFSATGVTRPTIVQSGATYSTSLSWTVTAGHTLVVVCQGTFTATDSMGDTFHVILSNGGSGTSVSYAYNIAGGTGTVGCSSNGTIAYELANVPTTANLDVSTSAATTGTSPQTVSVTTTQSNDLLLSGMGNNTAGTPAIYGTWSSLLNGFQGYGYASANRTLAGAAGNYSATWNYTASSQYIWMIAIKGVTASQTADIVDFNNATSTTVSKINAYGLPQTVAVTFSTLPTCTSGLEGTRAAVTDSTVTTGTITGGGANHVPAYCNGTNWVVD
jgi:hypothetical protein